MQLTRWTYINREFDPPSRFSKDQWCALIESEAVPGKVIAGIPFIDAARFSASTKLDPPSRVTSTQLSGIDLLR